MGSSGRVQRLREKMLGLPSVCIERGYWTTQSFMETESEPIAIRKAKALAKTLENMSIYIDDEELIVARATSKRCAGVILPEVKWTWWLEEMDTISTREWDRFVPLTEDEKAKMREFLPYWKGKSLSEKFFSMIPEHAQKMNGILQGGGATSAGGGYTGHNSFDYDLLLSQGLKGVKRQVDEELAKLNIVDLKDFQKYLFLNAVNISLDAAINFARRYANLAGSMAEKEKGPQRRAELEKIAEICAWVPENPARSFQEAVQSVWFAHLVDIVESCGGGPTLGRADQYLYPYYKKDRDAGKLTDEEARELLALFLIKRNEVILALDSIAAETFAGYGASASITLGGMTKDGRDATNELSYIFLDAEMDVRLREDFVIRIHKNTPDSFLIKACEVVKVVKGKLKFVGDETNILRLLNDGKPLDLARTYMITGCNTPSVGGSSFDIPGGIVNLPLMLELALNNGVQRLTGEQVGLKTGDPRQFKTYQEVWDAYKKQVEALIPNVIFVKHLDRQLFAWFAPLPFNSALHNGCIEKGLDINNGGTAPYVSHGTSLGGSPNVGDALAAIKKAVFEDKKISMDRLINALDKNFEGEDEVLHILNGCPKFGNDDDYVDSIVNEVLVHAAGEVGKIRGVAQGVSTAAAGTVTANIPLGRIVGALPDGRKAGEPLAEGGISPHQGRNVSGPTATMRSVAKLNLVKLTGGSVLNMRFNPDLLKDEIKIMKFASLIRTFLDSGGGLVQFNIVSTDTLKDAQKHPEKYKDLLVRVATYSAYFVELSPELQNDIINRMEFQDF